MTLRLRLFGPPDLSRDDLPVRLPTRKAQALLYFLAAEQRGHTRARLVDLLWPDAGEGSGRASLRVALSYVRDALGPAADSLRLDHDSVELTGSADLLCDLDDLRRAESSDDRANLEAAAAAYRGPFLDGFSVRDCPDLDDWIDVQRARWQRQITGVLSRLTRLQLDSGELAGAEHTAARWVELDPLDEAAYRALMRTRAAAGDISGAIAAYDSCRNVLQRELQTAPSRRTSDLAAQIGSRTAENGPRPGAAPADGGQLTPLAGRIAEFSRIVQRFRDLPDRGAGIAVVRGEAGIGKTRLAQEFLEWARLEGAETLAGRAFEASGQVSYGPLVDSLRPRIAHENAPDDLLPDVWLAELSRILPELRDRYPDLPAPIADDLTAGARLVESVIMAAESLSRRAPLVWLLDDIQWADGATLDTVRQAAGRWRALEAPILLVLTTRQESLGASPELADWISGLGREAPLLDISLGPLEERDLAGMLARILGGSDPSASIDHFAGWLFGETRGQPFFVAETLKDLLDRGMIVARRDGGPGFALARDSDFADPRLEMAPTIRATLLGRIRRLPADAFSLLVAAAVVGREAPFEHICRIAGLGEDSGLTALDRILAARLMTGAGGGRYLFAHDRIRDVAYTEAGDARRRIFHRRAFDLAKEERAPASDAAFHAIAAGLPGARDYLALAGDEAIRVFAIRDAIAYYERAKSMGATGDVLARLGRAHEVTGDMAGARAAYEAMLEEARRSGRLADECAALNLLATLIVHQQKDLDRAGSLLEEARRIADAAGDTRILAETELNLGIYSFLARWKPAAALDHVLRALDLARELGSDDLAARCLNMLLLAAPPIGRWNDAVHWAIECREIFSRLGNRAMEVDTLGQHSTALAQLGRIDEAERFAREAHSLAQSIDNPWGLVTSKFTLAMTLLAKGDDENALTLARESFALAGPRAVPVITYISAIVLATVLRNAGEFDEARRVLESTRDLPAFQPFTDQITEDLAVTATCAGDWAEAAALLLPLLPGRNEAMNLYRGLERDLEIEALLRAGAGDAARDDLTTFSEHVAESPRFAIVVLRCRAVFEHWKGNPAAAAALLDEAGDRSRELGIPLELRRTEAVRARLLDSRPNGGNVVV